MSSSIYDACMDIVNIHGKDCVRSYLDGNDQAIDEIHDFIRNRFPDIWQIYAQDDSPDLMNHLDIFFDTILLMNA